jgi:hypothetical protein
MSHRGEILDHSLSGLDFSPDGASVRLFLTDSVPPHATVVLSCEDLLTFRLDRTADDAIPYFLGEVRWQPLAASARPQALAQLGYSFLDERGRPLEPTWDQAVHLHFEGSVCGDIICRDCSVHEEEPTMSDPAPRPAQSHPGRSSS